MKMMLISELADEKEKLKTMLSENNFELIHYRSPIKAMDNFEEIDPEAVIINALDFPRHWKVITQYIRWDTTKEKLIIILLVDKSFDQNDISKAINAGVQGIIQLDNNSVSYIIDEIKHIFSHYDYVNKKVINDFSKKICFLFTNPINEVIITGTVKDISSDGIVFLPDMPVNTLSLMNNTILEQCSLQIANKTIVPACKIKSNTSVLYLEFIDLSQEDIKTINEFINNELDK